MFAPPHLPESRPAPVAPAVRQSSGPWPPRRIGLEEVPHPLSRTVFSSPYYSARGSYRGRLVWWRRKGRATGAQGTAPTSQSRPTTAGRDRSAAGLHRVTLPRSSPDGGGRPAGPSRHHPCRRHAPAPAGPEPDGHATRASATVRGPCLRDIWYSFCSLVEAVGRRLGRRAPLPTGLPPRDFGVAHRPLTGTGCDWPRVVDGSIAVVDRGSFARISSTTAMAT